ncbi:MAG: SDR family NAD(P)-dependent oxidoreductase [Gemmatimonadaceae bacterium]|nr:SDR family NAD(P)-dependent oxidoreductase [Gemmatimonadaceae bacterium]
MITGASDGIGRAAVHAFAAAGARVIMVGRNEAKTVAAARAIMGETGSRRVDWEIADLSRQEAVRDLALRLRQRAPRIDVLVNNAGAVFLERELTAEGFERTFALNHLAYFSLTLLLLESLSSAASPGHPSRVVCVASRAHRDAHLRVDDLQSERGYAGWRAYANSKLANVLFARALATRLDPARIVVHAMHPGVVSTRFGVNNGRRGRLMRRIMDVVSIGPDAGADTLVWLSTADAPGHSSGDYWVKRARIDPSEAALDDTLGQSLWVHSAALSHLDPDALIAASGAARAK